MIESPGFVISEEGTACGSVLVGGLKYRIHYGLHVRQDMADDSTSHLAYRPVLAYAAWAEPVLEDRELS